MTRIRKKLVSVRPLSTPEVSSSSVKAQNGHSKLRSTVLTLMKAPLQSKVVFRALPTSLSILTTRFFYFRSEEMKPEWFSLSPESDSTVAGNINLPPIPFSQMWETDHIWLPLLISQRNFIGRADFTRSGEELKPYKWWYGVLSPKC